MPDYRVSTTSYTEDLSVKILRQLGITAKRNNIATPTAVDLITDINGVKIDVQYSQDFEKWRDLRFDHVSAYSKGEVNKEYSKIGIFKKFESNYGFKVDKVGKHYQNDYLDAIIVLFYNKKLEIEDATKDYNPDKVLLATKEKLLKYIDENLDECIKNTKLNDKSKLGDIHGSAFIPIKFSKFNKDKNCYFGTIEELKSKSEEIKAYLGCKKETYKTL